LPTRAGLQLAQQQQQQQQNEVDDLLRQGAGVQSLVTFAKLYGFESAARGVVDSALLRATREGDHEQALDVLAHGASVAARDSSGRTALFLAVESRAPSLALIDALLAAGADPNAVDCAHSPLALYPIVRHDALSLRIVDALLAAGLRLDTPCNANSPVARSKSGSRGGSSMSLTAQASGAGRVLSLLEFAERNGASSAIVQRLRTARREGVLFAELSPNAFRAPETLAGSGVEYPQQQHAAGGASVDKRTFGLSYARQRRSAEDGRSSSDDRKRPRAL
jgi:hypothetical protein